MSTVATHGTTEHGDSEGSRTLRTARAHSATAASVGLLGTYPPAKCGIATFNASLAAAISAGGDVSYGVVASVEAPSPQRSPDVVAELVRDSPASLTAAARALDQFDVVVVQHEYGIYGGPDGRDVLDLLDEIDVPVIAVLHTVLNTPSPGQRNVLESLCARADAVVVQSRAARKRLLDLHGIDPRRVRLIPHGARANLSPQARGLDPTRPATILTWGLIGPGKGIEYGIRALAMLRDVQPTPRYVVLGQTHPKLLERCGESYRDGLVALAHELGVGDRVVFDDRYCTWDEVLEQVRAADVVLQPYLSRDQVVSGVLVDALASGRPVVATAYPHAVELLGEGSGLVVPFEDAGAIADALRSMLTDPGALERFEMAARRQAPTLYWETIGARYRKLASALVSEPLGVAV